MAIVVHFRETIAKVVIRHIRRAASDLDRGQYESGVY
jgi:hypothetical protein